MIYNQFLSCIGSHKQSHTIVQGLQLSDARDLEDILKGHLPVGAPNTGG